MSHFQYSPYGRDRSALMQMSGEDKRRETVRSEFAENYKRAESYFVSFFRLFNSAHPRDCLGYNIDEELMEEATETLRMAVRAYRLCHPEDQRTLDDKAQATWEHARCYSPHSCRVCSVIGRIMR
jgi:hypothetical protein